MNNMHTVYVHMYIYIYIYSSDSTYKGIHICIYKPDQLCKLVIVPIKYISLQVLDPSEQAALLEVLAEMVGLSALR